MNTILFVTWNKNKLQEARFYLKNHTVQEAWIEVPEIQDTDVHVVVKAKLQNAFSQTWVPCLVMDVSLVINGLCDQTKVSKQFPWALIKDVFSSMWAQNITKLVNNNDDYACKRTAILWYHDGKKEHYFSAALDWLIAQEPRWLQGYARDTIFIPHWETKTFAEMSFEEKQSHAIIKDLYQEFATFLYKK